MAKPPVSRLVEVTIENLKVGMYVQLHCHWLKHPFLLNRFKVTSSAELAAIRRLGRAAIQVDPTRSDPESLKNALASGADPIAQPGTVQAEPIIPAESEEEKALKIKKAERIQAFIRCQEQVKKANSSYLDALRQNKEAIEQVSAGREEGVTRATQMIEQVVDVLQKEDSATAMFNVINTKGFEARDFVSFHALNVCMVSMMLGRDFDLDREELLWLGIGALLHDIGERKIPSPVLNKQLKGAPLTRAEKTFLELHPAYGKSMAQSFSSFPPASAQIIHQHHERVDGSGYPGGLKDDAISLLTKIVMVADEYDHLTSHHNSNKRLHPAEALARMYANREKLFSTDVIVGLVRTLSVYPPGTIVHMSDGSLAMVISINFHAPTRPIVMLYEPGISKGNVVVLNLAEDMDLSIEKTLRPTEVPREALDFMNPQRMAGYLIQTLDQTDRPKEKR